MQHGVDQWYLVRGKQRRGAFTIAQVKELAVNSPLDGSVAIWHEGMEQAIPVTSLQQLDQLTERFGLPKAPDPQAGAPLTFNPATAGSTSAFHGQVAAHPSAVPTSPPAGASPQSPPQPRQDSQNYEPNTTVEIPASPFQGDQQSPFSGRQAFNPFEDSQADAPAPSRGGPVTSVTIGEDPAPGFGSPFQQAAPPAPPANPFQVQPIQSPPPAPGVPAAESPVVQAVAVEAQSPDPGGYSFSVVFITGLISFVAGLIIALLAVLVMASLESSPARDNRSNQANQPSENRAGVQTPSQRPGSDSSIGRLAKKLADQITDFNEKAGNPFIAQVVSARARRQVDATGTLQTVGLIKLSGRDPQGLIELNIELVQQKEQWEKLSATGTIATNEGRTELLDTAALRRLGVDSSLRSVLDAKAAP